MMEGMSRVCDFQFTRYNNGYVDIKRIQNVFAAYGVSLDAVTLY